MPTDSMQPATKQEMMVLQTYGSMYLSGIEPVNIQNMYEDPQMNTDQLGEALAGMAEGSRAGLERAGNIVQMVFAAAQIITQVVGIFSVGIGTVIGAALQIVGRIVQVFIGKAASAACDDLDKCVRGGPRERHILQRRAMVGIDPPADYTILAPGPLLFPIPVRRAGAKPYDGYDEEAGFANSCRIKHYGGSKSSCRSSWGLFANFMNDGMWWWGKKDAEKHSDVLGGTVIGVQGRVGGSTVLSPKRERRVVRAPSSKSIMRGCHRSMYSRAFTPKLEGMGEEIHSDKDLSPEFKARQEAVTLVLRWMDESMSFKILNCFEDLMRNERGSAVYRVAESCHQERGCPETSIAHYMKQPNQEKSFRGAEPSNRKTCSRIYASIRAMFQAVVATAERIGPDALTTVLGRIDPPLRDKEAVRRAFPKAIAAQHKGVDIWPEKPLADVVTWAELQNLNNFIMRHVKDEILTDEAAAAAFAEIGDEQEQRARFLAMSPFERNRRKAVAAAEKAVRNQKMGAGYGISYAPLVRRRMRELAVDPRAIGPGGLGRYAYFIPPWAMYGGAAALTAASIYLLIKAREEENDG